jgi:hypothetical protein
VVVPVGSLQRTVGIVAIACGIIFLPLLFLLVSVGVIALLTFTGFAVWWGVLEEQRRREQHEANQEYDAEIAELLAAAKRELRQWQEQLAAQQTRAREQYERRLAAEKARVKQAEERFAAEQAKAKWQYEESLRPWTQAMSALRNEAARRKQARETAQQRLRAAETNWHTAASRWRDDFERKKDELRHLRQHHEKLVSEHAIELQRLQARSREMQLEQHLQQHFISDIQDGVIGPTRKATLASFGIETAGDVEEHAVRQVPGFGAKLTNRLLLWRKEVERRFVFTAAVGVSPQMQQALDLKYAPARQQVEQKLLAGEGELRAIARQAEEELQSLYGPIVACMQMLDQCELDLTLIPQSV